MRPKKLTAYKAWKTGQFMRVAIIDRPGQDPEIMVMDRKGRLGRAKVKNLGRPDEECIYDEDLKRPGQA